ncbi:MAG: L,D-transpeptidase [Bacillota bacterium]
MFRPRNWVLVAESPEILIDVEARLLTFFRMGRFYKVYPCGVGRPSTPTPRGRWHIVAKIRHPEWEALGTRWMELDVPWGRYGIHGTNAPWSIGHWVSNGCIRMYNQDVEELYDLAPLGTPVRIVGRYPGEPVSPAP